MKEKKEKICKLKKILEATTEGRHRRLVERNLEDAKRELVEVLPLPLPPRKKKFTCNFFLCNYI